MAMMKYDVGDNFDVKTLNNAIDDFNGKTMSTWGFYQNYYYPYVIKETYPVYLQERAQDKGKQAFEIIKVLKDKKLVNLSKVENFIDLMDELIKIL